MNELVVADRAAEWRKLKALVLDRISSPITRRVYDLGLDEFIEWYMQEPRAGFTKATVTAWRVDLEARKLGPISINVRLTAVRKLAVEAADNGLLAPALAAGITRIKGVRAQGVRTGNWLSRSQAQALLNAPDTRDTGDEGARLHVSNSNDMVVGSCPRAPNRDVVVAREPRRVQTPDAPFSAHAQPTSRPMSFRLLL